MNDSNSDMAESDIRNSDCHMNKNKTNAWITLLTGLDMLGFVSASLSATSARLSSTSSLKKINKVSNQFVPKQQCGI